MAAEFMGLNRGWRRPPGTMPGRRLPRPKHLTKMPTKKATIKKGADATAAAASPAERVVASGTGREASADEARDILKLMGGEPEAAESETEDPEEDGEKPADEGESGAEESEAEPDEGAEGEPADQDKDGAEDGAEDDGEGEAAAEGEDEGAEGDEPEAAAAEAEGEAKPKKGDGLPKGVRTELFKLREKTRQQEQELATLRQAPGGHGVTPAEQEVLQAETPEQLEAVRLKLESIEDQALANPDGYEGAAAKEGEEPQVVDAATVQRALTNVRRALRLLPRREQAIVATQRANAEAAKLFPELEDPDSEQSVYLESVLRRVPQLRQLPDYRLLIADAHANRQARQRKAAATRDGRPLPGKPVQAHRQPPPAVPGAPARAASAPAPRAVKLRALRERASATGSEADLANLIEAGMPG